MTVKEYISGKFQSFGIYLSEADLLDIALSSGVEMDSVMSNEMIGKVNIGIAKFIPQLMLRPTSISENGFSMSWNKDGIKSYYAYLCSIYGINDVLSTKPKVSFL